MGSNPNRDMLFISHASEDNDLTRWLALQLAKEGYGVWCDLTKLLGGENWPREINQALQAGTQKFLFVLSKHSNSKHDPQGELTTAFNIMKEEKIENFIVPLRVDDLEHSKTDYRLQNIQSIPFNSSWAEGLNQLLRMLERDHAEKHKSFTPDAVNVWWKNYISADDAINNTLETLFSNRYPVISCPQFIYAHHVINIPYIKDFVPCIFIPFKQYLLSFTEVEGLCQNIDRLEIIKTEKLHINTFLEGTGNLIEDSRQGCRLVVRLFNQALWKSLQVKGLLPYSLSNRKICFYFHKDVLKDGRIIYTGNRELSSLTKLWGETLGEKWHWAIRGWFEIIPSWHYNIQYHIVVSNRKGEIRSAPKRVYRRWNNSTWRDRLRASMFHLAEDNDKIIIPVNSNQGICVDKNPINFTSPFSFVEPSAYILEDEE